MTGDWLTGFMVDFGIVKLTGSRMGPANVDSEPGGTVDYHKRDIGLCLFCSLI